MANWKGIKSYISFKRNKILAVTFSGAALLLFIAFFIWNNATNGWPFFTKFNLSTAWSTVLTLIVYLIIFTCNIRNDNFAYSGIMLFVSIAFIGQFFALISGSYNVTSAFSSGKPGLIIYAILGFLLCVSMLVVGVILYIRSFRYMARRDNDFRIIRILSIVFAGLLFALLAYNICWPIAFGYSWSAINANYIWFFSDRIADCLMGVAIVFTFERLRRI